MFKELINRTPFSNNIAHEVFSNIQGDNFNGDVSFLSSIRALLSPRLEEDESITLRFMGSSYSQDLLKERGYKNAISAVYDDSYYSNGSLTVYEFRGYEPDNKAWLSKIKNDFTKAYKSYTLVERFTTFFSNSFEIYLFVDEKHKKSVIFCEYLNFQMLHYIQVGIPLIFPWYFSEGKELIKGSVEHQLINSFLSSTSTDYMETLKVLAEPYDFRGAKIRNLLQGFEAKNESRILQTMEMDIRSYIESINQYNARISEFLKKKRDAEIRILGLKEKVAEENENSELMNFFLCNKNLELETVTDDGYIQFYVTGKAEFFDEDYAERIINNDNSFAYYNQQGSYESYIPRDDMKMLLKAIFIDQILSIRFCAKYRFSLTGNVNGLSHPSYRDISANCMPNPHIHYHACMGDYTRIINDMLASGNYIGAISQCIASCKSLNFKDTVVMNDFFRTFYGVTGYDGYRKFIELPDGSVVEPLEAIEWLKSQQESEQPTESEDDIDE